MSEQRQGGWYWVELNRKTSALQQSLNQIDAFLAQNGVQVIDGNYPKALADLMCCNVGRGKTW